MNRDPAFLNTIAIEREVIIFDNTGIGRSTGEVPLLMSDWAKDMLLFIEALGIDKIDLLGFSIGGPPGKNTGYQNERQTDLVLSA